MDFEKLVLEKLENIQEDVTELRIVNAEQTKDIHQNTKDLAEHIRRTDLLEEKLELQKKAVNQRFQKIEEPRTTVKSVGKFLVWAGGIGGAIYGIYRGYLAIQHLF